MAAFNTFIQANLRKPVLAEAKGMSGQVVVGGVVEPDGRVSNVSVIKSLRPDCDREAVRVFRLFNAWQPAQKNGKTVRQQVNALIQFKPNTPFIYANGARISYFDADNKPIADTNQARYKQLAPLDSINGLPAGDIVVYRTKGKTWKEEYRLPLIREKNVSRKDSDKAIYLIGYQNGYQQWDGELFTVDNADGRIRQEYYQHGKKSGPELSYHGNGIIAEKIDDFDEKQVITSWYSTGQIKRIRIVTKNKPLAPAIQSEQVVAVWDTIGNQYVKEGNGRAIYHTERTSRSDTTKQTSFTEEGLYKDGFQQGIWTGYCADKSYFYEEQYDKGICLGGKSCSAGGDTVRYTDLGQMPEFTGGMQGLGQFLSQNLRYPANAQRARTQGKVFVSFTVCTDGTLCDYQVVKGAHPDLDQEAVRVVKQMSGRWKPGVQRGEKVRVKYNLPINFSLN
ncbi:energy transducer TonB [Spirosoma areae]